jgi:hypothetical protein
MRNNKKAILPIVISIFSLVIPNEGPQAAAQSQRHLTEFEKHFLRLSNIQKNLDAAANPAEVLARMTNKATGNIPKDMYLYNAICERYVQSRKDLNELALTIIPSATPTQQAQITKLLNKFNSAVDRLKREYPYADKEYRHKLTWTQRRQVQKAKKTGTDAVGALSQVQPPSQY